MKPESQSRTSEGQSRSAKKRQEKEQPPALSDRSAELPAAAANATSSVTVAEPPIAGNHGDEAVVASQEQGNSGEEVSSEPETPAKVYANIIHQYLGKIESLKDCAKYLLPVMSVLTVKRREELRDYFSNFESEDSSTSSGHNKSYKIPLGAYDVFHRSLRDFERIGSTNEILINSLFVSLFTLQDAVLGDVLRHLLLESPARAALAERSLTYSDLAEFASIDDARWHLINQEVETFLRKSYDEQFDYLETKFKVKLRVDLPIWSTYVECSQRRNLVVHTNSKVTKQYLTVCRRHNVVFTDGEPAVGNRLKISSDYLKAAIKACHEIAVKLAYVLQRKLLPEQAKEADAFLSNHVYDLLVDERWQDAIVFGSFLNSIPNLSTDFIRRRNIINLAQAYKWSGNARSCLELLSKEDWSASSLEFQLCVHVLKDEWPEVLGIMPRLKESDLIVKSSYRTWPLFKELRKQEEFQSAYERIYGERFTKDVDAAVTESVTEALSPKSVWKNFDKAVTASPDEVDKYRKGIDALEKEFEQPLARDHSVNTRAIDAPKASSD